MIKRQEDMGMLTEKQWPAHYSFWDRVDNRIRDIPIDDLALRLALSTSPILKRRGSFKDSIDFTKPGI